MQFDNNNDIVEKIVYYCCKTLKTVVKSFMVF